MSRKRPSVIDLASEDISPDAAETPTSNVVAIQGKEPPTDVRLEPKYAYLIPRARLLYIDNLLLALNIGLAEMSRIRPDLFMDLKYQRPLRKGDTDEGMPAPYVAVDTSLVPVPSKYMSALDWFITGWSQFLDVTDAQDQRAQGFMQKFQTHLTTLTAA